MAKDQNPLNEEQLSNKIQVIRKLVMHENELVNQRIGWLTQVQGLLFAALAFAWEKAPEAFTIMLSVMGIAVALSLWTALNMYSPAVRDLVAWLDYRLPQDQNIEDLLVLGRRKESNGIGWLLRPWRALPLIFVLGWITVILIAVST